MRWGPRRAPPPPPTPHPHPPTPPHTRNTPPHAARAPLSCKQLHILHRLVRHGGQHLAAGEERGGGGGAGTRAVRGVGQASRPAGRQARRRVPLLGTHRRSVGSMARRPPGAPTGWVTVNARDSSSREEGRDLVCVWGWGVEGSEGGVTSASAAPPPPLPPHSSPVERPVQPLCQLLAHKGGRPLAIGGTHAARPGRGAGGGEGGAAAG